MRRLSPSETGNIPEAPTLRFPLSYSILRDQNVPYTQALSCLSKPVPVSFWGRGVATLFTEGSSHLVFRSAWSHFAL